MGDPVFDFLDSGGKSAAPAPAKPAPSSSVSNDPVYDFLNSGGKGFVSAGPKTLAPVVASAQPSPLGVRTPAPDEDDTGPLPGVVGHAITGIGSSIMSGWHGLAALASGGTLDDAANAVRDYSEKHTYQPEEGSSASKALDVLDTPANPLTWVSRGAKAGAEYAVDKGVAPGVAAVGEGIANVAPMLLGVRGGAASEARVIPFTRVEPTLRGEAPIVKAAPLTEPGIGTPLPSVGGRAEPVLSPQAEVEATQAKVKTATDWAKAQKDLYEALDKAEPKAVIDDLQAKASAAEQAHKQLELVPAEPKPVTPTETPQTPAANQQQFIGPDEAEVPTFSSSAPPVEGGLPAAEQSSRAQVLQRIGLSEARQSAIAGDAKAAATDFQTSKLDNPAGNYMRSVLDGEREALQGHAERLIQDTGGTVGTDSSALYGRGNTILEPLDKLKQWFDTKTSELYKEADKRAGGIPAEMPKTQEFVGGDQAEFLGTTEGESLLKGIKARMKSLGLVDADGNPLAVTVAQAEKLKQYLNNQWQPRTARLIRGMKDAIDDDVMQTAGQDVYQKARAMRAMRAVTLDDPNGIAKIMDASGPEGINRSVSVEKVADSIAAVPVDQLAHIVKTLKNVPPELKPQAEAALSEIKAQFANKIHDAGAGRVGQWGSRDVSKYLNNNAARLQQVFSPEELAKFDDLNEAGHILARDQSYPGAAVQEHNLVQRGVMGAVRSGSAAIGGFVGGPAGAAAGDLIGGTISKRIGESSALKSTQKRVRKLSDFPGASD